MDSRPQPRPSLTPRERQVLHLVAEGLTDQGIARRLGLSVSTVHDHEERLRAKLQAGNRARLVLEAVRLGLLAPPPAGQASDRIEEPGRTTD